MFYFLLERLRAVTEEEQVPPWTLSAGEKYLVEIEPMLQRAGYKGTIIGSVAIEGFSEHDLDIWLEPIADEGDFGVIEDEIPMEGMDYIGEDPPHYTILPDGKSVDFHLAEEEGELEEGKEESEEDEKEKFFVDRTDKHIKLVQEAAAKIVEAYPEFDELLKQVEVHDASKLEEPERTPYIEITWRHKLENEKGEYDPYNGKGYQTPGQLEKEDENEATIHHITTNSHHPEYHLEDKSDANISNTNRDESDECIDASRMPDVDVAEMVADWAAMAEELGTNSSREWFDKQKDVRWHFSEHQEELIDKLLKVFEEIGESAVVEESKHSRDKCMDCSSIPEVEVLWAEGMGHCWFCMKHFKEWATKGDGKGDVCAVKKIQKGKAATDWKSNTSPNIMDTMKFLKESREELIDRLLKVFE